MVRKIRDKRDTQVPEITTAPPKVLTEGEVPAVKLEEPNGVAERRAYAPSNTAVSGTRGVPQLKVQADNVGKPEAAAKPPPEIPTTGSKAVAVQYGTWASNYDEETASYGWCAPMVLLGSLVKEAPPNASLRVLDIGVGTGLGSVPYLADGAQVTGLDIAPEMLREARTHHPEFHQLERYDMDEPLSTVGIKKDAFDVVLSSGVLHFAKDIEATLSTAIDALAPGGTIAFTYIPDQEREFGKSTLTHPSGDVERILTARGMTILQDSAFVAYHDKGDIDDPVIYGLMVARKPGTQVQVPAELAAVLGRTSSVDRERVLRAYASPLIRGPLETKLVGPKDSEHRRQITAMMDAFRTMTEVDALDPKKIPLPTATPSLATQGKPGCDVLMLFAHPDDESGYAGGTTALLTRAGYDVHLAHATGGGGGRRTGGDSGDLLSVRSREESLALERLGVEHFTDLGFTDFGKYTDTHRREPVTATGTLDRWGATALLEKMVRAIREQRPRTIISFDPERDPNYSLHGHHLAAGTAAMLAFHLAADPEAFPEQLKAGLRPWAAERQQAIEPPHAKSDRITDITFDTSDKIAALDAHASQFYSTEGWLKKLGASPGGRSSERWHLLQSRVGGGAEMDDPLARLIGFHPSEERRAEAARVRPAVEAIPLKPNANAQLTAIRQRSEKLDELYRFRPIDEIRDEVLAHAYPRNELCSLLKAQNVARGASKETLHNIEMLRDPETVAVVTGQQVGLFGGPLYSLFKALAAIKEVESLRQRGIRAVPVFWLASYDHDFKEVNDAKFVANDVVALKLGAKHELEPVGDILLGKDVERVLADAEKALGDAPFAREVMADLREIYQPDETFAGAFAKWMGKLTARYGLITLDPNRREFNALARPLLEKELFSDRPSGPIIEETNAKLKALGFEPQIAPRGEMLNLFFIDDTGRRVTLKRKDGGFETGGKPAFLDADTVRKYLDEAPERFSPSALLRPLVEDTVLPTLGYVGGPSERKYYGQIAALYDWAGLTFPAVLARPSFALAKKADVRKLEEKLGRPAPEALESETLSKEIGRAGVPKNVLACFERLESIADSITPFDKDLDARMLKGERESVFAELAAIRSGIDSGLEDARKAVQAAGLERLERGLEAAIARIKPALEGFERDLRAADPKSGRTPSHHGLSVARMALGSLTEQLAKVGRAENKDLMALVTRLLPRGEMQEREMSIAQLMADYGPGIIDQLVRRAKTDQAAPELILVDIDANPKA